MNHDTPRPADLHPPRRRHRAPATAAADPAAVPCPQCGAAMHGVRGSRHAICPNCGFKDACCY